MIYIKYKHQDIVLSCLRRWHSIFIPHVLTHDEVRDGHINFIATYKEHGSYANHWTDRPSDPIEDPD